MSENLSPRFSLRLNPLVPLAVLFLLGIVLGRSFPLPPGVALAIAAVAWLAWLFVERFHGRSRGAVAAALLAAATFAFGAAVWNADQVQVEETHLARFVPAGEEIPVAIRMSVLAAPEGPSHAGESLLARTLEVLTTSGWIPATGDAKLHWRVRDGGAKLSPGQVIEVFGWASRPEAPRNPGGIDQRSRLAADCIFVQIRVPRAGGIRPIDEASGKRVSLVEQFRLYLRGKFLAHTLDEDVPAAYALTALLLGYRDPAASDVSQAFADAGVAHLLAISGSHIVFFALMAWWAVMFIPLRPRHRELLIAIIVGLYVLATPCGPPIVRAAIALGMLVLSRLIGRPSQYLNMLAAAAIVIVLWRPADITDAGFQLSFASTAGLILFAERLYTALFGRYLERQQLIADLAATRWARRRLLMKKWASAAFVANLIGAATAAPLVAFHFGQVNLWAIPAGMLALPVVSGAMVFSALQLLAEMVGLGALLAGPVVLTGKAMIWVVQLLASLPGSALALRAPPWYLVTLLYVAMILVILRKPLRMTRAQAVNVSVATIVFTAGWYAFTLPVHRLELTVLSVGQTSSLLLRTPDGNLWAIDAAAPRGSNPTSALSSALRVAGERRLSGLILTQLDAPHASSAADVVERYRPSTIYLSEPDWEHKGETLAGASLSAAATISHTLVTTLHAGQRLSLANGASLDILWPPETQSALDHPNLIVMLSFANTRILIADPHAQRPLAALLMADPTLRADVLIFTNQERGAADSPLRATVATLQARTILWTSRGSWAPRISAPNEFNAADSAIHLTIAQNGDLQLATQITSPQSP